ncbi:MAG: M28 family peptidase, partial [Flavobacterium sp.]|nr:M28 family peptidase [Flavobacterium sp.]
MKNLTKSLMISLLATVYGNTTQAQTFIQSYANVVNQASQSGILTNLTEFENLGVKYRGTLAQANTLQWLKNKYLSYGYTASQLSEDVFTYSGATCKNLIVTKIGTVYPNTYVIVCGHYDTITGTGTNDNGSGVSTILEVARLLQNIPTEYSIKFINFSG